jgi:hypothetical protein
MNLPILVAAGYLGEMTCTCVCLVFLIGFSLSDRETDVNHTLDEYAESAYESSYRWSLHLDRSKEW